MNRASTPAVLHCSWMRDWSQRWLSSRRLNDKLWRPVCLFLPRWMCPSLIHSVSVCMWKRKGERNGEVVQLKLNDVTRHQLTMDILLSLSNTLPLILRTLLVHNKTTKNNVSFAGRAVIYCSSGDIMMKLNVKPKCQKASACPVLQFSSLHSRQRDRPSAAQCPERYTGNHKWGED